MAKGHVTQFTLALKIGILTCLLSFYISLFLETSDGLSSLICLFRHYPAISVTWAGFGAVRHLMLLSHLDLKFPLAMFIVFFSNLKKMVTPSFSRRGRKTQWPSFLWASFIAWDYSPVIVMKSQRGIDLGSGIHLFPLCLETGRVLWAVVVFYDFFPLLLFPFSPDYLPPGRHW